MCGVFSKKERFFLLDGWIVGGKVGQNWEVGYPQTARGVDLRKGGGREGDKLISALYRCSF